MKHPKYLFRSDDGQRWTLQSNGKYWMDESKMPKDMKEYYISYEILMRFGFVDSLKKCKIIKHPSIRDFTPADINYFRENGML